MKSSHENKESLRKVLHFPCICNLRHEFLNKLLRASQQLLMIVTTHAHAHGQSNIDMTLLHLPRKRNLVQCLCNVSVSRIATPHLRKDFVGFIEFLKSRQSLREAETRLLPEELQWFDVAFTSLQEFSGRPGVMCCRFKLCQAEPRFCTIRQDHGYCLFVVVTTQLALQRTGVPLFGSSKILFLESTGSLILEFLSSQSFREVPKHRCRCRRCEQAPAQTRR
mmetsp:Transcript_18673/g.40027  ORF Transcript_18673/g.40027 Transcript_18673/m.40027 type:complete len:222 (+) Transcript_18673:1902-2567(+)